MPMLYIVPIGCPLGIGYPKGMCMGTNLCPMDIDMDGYRKKIMVWVWVEKGRTLPYPMIAIPTYP